MLITEDFFQANILENKDDKIVSHLDSLDEIQEMGPKPNLYVDTAVNGGACKVEVLTSFEILKRQIMKKAANRTK